jgi:hypothetical protein
MRGRFIVPFKVCFCLLLLAKHTFWRFNGVGIIARRNGGALVTDVFKLIGKRLKGFTLKELKQMNYREFAFSKILAKSFSVI